METNNTKEEQILIRITGNDRPGLTTSIMEILASKDAKIIIEIADADKLPFFIFFVVKIKCFLEKRSIIFHREGML